MILTVCLLPSHEACIIIRPTLKNKNLTSGFLFFFVKYVMTLIKNTYLFVVSDGIENPKFFFSPWNYIQHRNHNTVFVVKKDAHRAATT